MYHIIDELQAFKSILKIIFAKPLCHSHLVIIDIKDVSQIVSVAKDKSEEPVNSFGAPEILRSRPPFASFNDHGDKSLADKDSRTLDAVETQEESADEDDDFDSRVFEELVLDLER